MGVPELRREDGRRIYRYEISAFATDHAMFTDVLSGTVWLSDEEYEAARASVPPAHKGLLFLAPVERAADDAASLGRAIKDTLDEAHADSRRCGCA